MQQQNPVLIETERLTIREFTRDDLEVLVQLLADAKVMQYYPAPLSRTEAQHWLERVLDDYNKHGMSWWCVELRGSGEFVGQAGLVVRTLDGNESYLLGYMFAREFWGNGYASEAARGVIEYGLGHLGIPRIDCPIRPENGPSIRLARRL